MNTNTKPIWYGHLQYEFRDKEQHPINPHDSLEKIFNDYWNIKQHNYSFLEESIEKDYLSKWDWSMTLQNFFDMTDEYFSAIEFLLQKRHVLFHHTTLSLLSANITMKAKPHHIEIFIQDHGFPHHISYDETDNEISLFNKIIAHHTQHEILKIKKSPFYSEDIKHIKNYRQKYLYYKRHYETPFIDCPYPFYSYLIGVNHDNFLRKTRPFLKNTIIKGYHYNKND